MQTRRRARRPALSLEALEDRTVPSAGLVGDMVVFGDSLADTGNASLATGGAFPNSAYYSQGRFSNGPLWVDSLAEYLGEPAVRPSLAGGLDYAFGGALAESNPPSPAGAPSIGTQVGAYLNGHHPKGDDLFVLIGGANDFFYTSPTVPPNEPAAAMRSSLDALYAAGGRNFVVSNLPPLGETPEFNQLPQPVKDSINGWSGAYNYYLSQELADFAGDHPSTHVISVDMAGLFQQTIAAPGTFGFTNVTDAALLAAPGTDTSGYLFFDTVHPTTKGHQILGLNAAARVGEALGFDTITVTNTTDAVNPLDGGLSLREAVNLANAQAGTQSIKFKIGEANTIKLGAELKLTDDVVINGPARELTLDGQGKTRLFNIAQGANVTLNSLTLTGGWAEQGGAIYNAGDLALNLVTVRNNAAKVGGGVYNAGSLRVLASALVNNSATAQGGAIYNASGSQARIVLSLVSGNRAAKGGGLYAAHGSTVDVALSIVLLNLGGNVSTGN